jgi:predicted RNase H-like nuclease (RuvC/YqgF family)
MEQKDSKIFNKTTMQAVSAFCDSNGIKDQDEFMYLCFKQGFDIKRFGFLGKTGIVSEKQVEIEVIKEIRVEVPVEIIKEVEKIVEVIKEVPVEKVVIKEIIKEVPIEKVVTKIEYVGDKNIENELLLKIQQLENEVSKKVVELDELRRNLDVKVDDNKVKMLQTTIQNLTTEVRDLKKKNEELNKQMLVLPKESDFTKARFHGSSNLNDDLYK